MLTKELEYYFVRLEQKLIKKQREGYNIKDEKTK